MPRTIAHIALTALFLAVLTPVGAQVTSPTDTTRAGRPLDPEREAQLARRGGGVRFGLWNVRGLDVASGGEESETPAFEGYVRKGLDAHLALENSVGFWRHRQLVTTTGGPLGGTTTSRIDAYVVPQQTSVVFFPATRPHQRVEPFLRGGIGLTLGVEDRKGEGGSLFSPGDDGISMVFGFGATGGGGVEWRLADALGISASARYQWVRFLQELAGKDTYQGLGADVGITYRFQFR
jgi:hypothetical protein